VKSVYSIFLKGLLTILPVAVTIYVLIWLGQGLESILGAGLRYALPDNWYVPGLGVVVGLVAVFLVGLLFQAWFVRQSWGWVEAMLDRVPLVREVYSSLRQVAEYLSGSQGAKADQVVMLTLGDPPVRLVGLVTRQDFSDAPDGIGDDQTLAVFLPWSYQLGGFTVYVPRSMTEPVDLSPQEALRWALTGGVTAQRRQLPHAGRHPGTP
jgi:uncharacterized membrane protein